MALRQRVRRWALRRQGNDVLPTTLTARRIYILPSASGWMFALLIIVMFIAGMNYGNGLALLLTFWMTGFALVAMVQTQRSLAGTRLLEASAAPVHAGSSVPLRIHVAATRSAEDLRFSAADSANQSRLTASDEISSQLLLEIPAPRRGPWRAPVLRLETIAPFGLFRSWTWLTLDIATVVYPEARGNLSVPETAGDDTGIEQLNHSQDELAGLRDFREGDSPRQVAWKAYARGAPLLVREYRGYSAGAHDFDYVALRDLDVEARLSQLTSWIVNAASRGEPWTLRLPDEAPISGSGADHRAHCLARLGLFGFRGERTA